MAIQHSELHVAASEIREAIGEEGRRIAAAIERASIKTHEAANLIAEAIDRYAKVLTIVANQQAIEASKERRIVAKRCAGTIEGIAVRNAEVGNPLHHTLNSDESQHLNIAAALLRKL